MNEGDVRSEFRAAWLRGPKSREAARRRSFISMNEPGRGSTMGAPDCMVVVGKSGRVLPIEFKWGHLAKYPDADPRYHDVVMPEKVRPSQFRWWTEYHESGGWAGLLLIGALQTRGRGKGQMGVWAINSRLIGDWKVGYMTNRDAYAVKLSGTERVKRQIERIVSVDMGLMPRSEIENTIYVPKFDDEGRPRYKKKGVIEI